ncbi:MAG TPA: PP2C family serine/threonine-protein phosphatase [Bryobacteraceae bacterium]|jgi:serine/threonine protein phosphatase PrpC
MECPFCTASLPDDDFFCEACGKPLAQPVPSAPAESGCTCGASPEEIDEEGYCGRCGRLARRPASDHVELVISDAFAGVSDRGIKHQRNEDRFAMRQANSGYVLVVCDGVSSSTQSEQASSLVAESVAKSLEASLRRHSASSPERTVRTAIYEAQSKLAAEAFDSSDPPSTTVVAALVKELDVTIGWAGDSRAYWFGADGAPQQLTSDHSWLNEVVASGAMPAEEAAKAPQAHGITRWLGSDAGENAQSDVVQFSIPGPGYLLLCTDGLWNYTMDPAALWAEMLGASAIEITRHLIEFAIEQGGHDNITAALLKVGVTVQ